MKIKLSFLLILIVFAHILNGQSYQIMRYGIKDGLCHESTNSVIQDSNGYLWISTTQGLCRLDGKNFDSQFLGDTLPTSIASTSFIDSKNRLWFGYKDGEIVMYDGSRFEVINLQEGSSSIIGFAEDDGGNILAMTQQSGLVIINEKFKTDFHTQAFSGLFASHFHLARDGNLLIGGFNGITLFTKNDTGSYTNAGRLTDIPYVQVFDIIDGSIDNLYYVGTDEDGLYALSGSGNDPAAYSASKLGVDQGLQYGIIKSLMLDDNGYLWVSDFGVGVYRFKLNEPFELSEGRLFSVSGGLPEEYIENIYKDDEGNIWFASNSNGIAVLRDQAFTFFDLINGDLDVPEISAICMEGDYYWFGSSSGELYLAGPVTSGGFKKYTSSNGLTGESITALWQDENYDLYIGTLTSGVFRMERSGAFARNFFTADNSLGNSVNAIDGDKQFIWIATNGGLYKIDKSTGEVEIQNTSTGLPHNVINDVLVDRDGHTWIATKGSGIYCVNDDDPALDIIIQGNPKLEFGCLTEDNKGQIWAGSSEDGVFKFTEDSLKVYSTEQGLKSKYTYAIDIDSKGFVWVGHRLGLSKINPKTGNVAIFDQEMGFTSDVLHRSIESNKEGLTLFGTNNGLIVYDANQSRPDTVPPRLNISQLNISDSIYDVSGDISLPYGIYKLRIDYVGINLSNPDQVLYRYKLDGFDEWSEPTRETFAKYSRIEDGDYTFMLSACDGNGNCTGEVAMFNISVKIPIWKAWWFIVSLVVIAIASVFLIIKIRERNQKALQEYLEQQLEERTREVIQQKEEIEIKNRDITDSINYAQRIQASILPPLQRLRTAFPESFVFYQPRDIVSGDFYWYDKLDEERFLIVCADSTGHGVPGAFMSMIGTTLIKDICQRPGVITPSDVLRTLDREVRSALHQNKESDGSNDGMDIIVAEINMKTNKLTVSSAMRPVVLYLNEEQIYVKGSRSSVGGQLDDTNLDKDFANEEFMMSQGDILYMFSDGYPDQFGGPLGRKFKMARLKNLLRDINKKPMEEQYNYVKSNFFLWKEDLEQVDDVLFMGIKIHPPDFIDKH